jgi:hypothetical protein
MAKNNDESASYFGVARRRWEELDPEDRWRLIELRVKEAARQIDPETFVSWWEYGSIVDPYATGYRGEDNIGRTWWVANPDGSGPPVTAWDFAATHPELDLGPKELRAREEQWSRDSDPLCLLLTRRPSS